MPPLFLCIMANSMGSIISSAIQGTVGLTGIFANNLTEGLTTKKTNKTNMQIAQMNNEFNAEMMQKQMDYNTEMYERSLEDTSPAAQMSRYRAAGINPYMAVGNISGGFGQTSGVSAAQANPVQIQKPHFDFSQISQVIGAALESYNNMRMTNANERRVNEEANQVYIENQYRGAKLAAEIADLKSSARSRDAQAILAQTETNLNNALYAGRIQNLDLQNQGLRLVNDFRSMDNAMKAIELKNFPVQVRLNIANLQQDILTKMQGRKLSEQQIRFMVQQGLKTVAETSGIKFTNDMNRKAESYLFDQIRYETESKRNNQGVKGGLPQQISNSIYNYLNPNR